MPRPPVDPILALRRKRVIRVRAILRNLRPNFNYFKLKCFTHEFPGNLTLRLKPGPGESEPLGG
eukprot:476456-Hanusia_phi.AAC.1